MPRRSKAGRAIQVKNKATDLNLINKQAAGIDIGADRHLVAVPPATATDCVRQFGAFTADLHALADWLAQCGVKTVAMESTGVYWIALYEVLESRGFDVKLVDARKVRNVSGRKSDVLDCQWLQQLHSYGLLEGAFRPGDEIVALRGYWRQREMLIKSAASHIQHMQKALQQMNLRLDNVVSDVTGQTGMAIIKAIVGGERDAKKLAEYRNHRCHRSAEEIAASLEGNYRAEHLFALRQAVELYEFYQAKIEECEQQIEQYLRKLPHNREDDRPRLGKWQKRHEVSFDVRDKLYKLVGVDLFRVPGLNAETLMTLYSEVGADMKKWPTEKHFTSWLSLCPGTKISGGKVLSRKTKPSRNRAAGAFRQAAVCAGRTETSLGAFYRRLKARLGPAKAATATAHKIARMYYHLVKNGEEYEEAGAVVYEEKYRARVVKNLKKRAQSLGYELTPVAA
jgi:transposase